MKAKLVRQDQIDFKFITANDEPEEVKLSKKQRRTIMMAGMKYGDGDNSEISNPSFKKMKEDIAMKDIQN